MSYTIEGSVKDFYANLICKTKFEHADEEYEDTPRGIEIIHYNRTNSPEYTEVTVRFNDKRIRMTIEFLDEPEEEESPCDQYG